MRWLDAIGGAACMTLFLALLLLFREIGRGL